MQFQKIFYKIRDIFKELSEPPLNDYTESTILTNKVRSALISRGYEEHSTVDYLGTFTSGTATLNQFYKRFIKNDREIIIRIGISLPIVNKLDKMTIHYMTDEYIDWTEIPVCQFLFNPEIALESFENRVEQMFHYFEKKKTG